MSELTTVARPYAQAAFDFALEKQVLEQWSTMLSFAAAVSADEGMKAVLTSGESADKLAEIFIQVCTPELDEHGQNLIKVMAENGRLIALPDVAAMYEVLVTEHQKVADVYVTSAVELTAEKQASISESMEKRLSRKVRLHCDVDPTIVGGMIIKADDLVIDNTVRGQLNRLADTLQS